jgi:iron complex transport system substrate-binding protein
MRRAWPYIFLCAAALNFGCAKSFKYIKLAPRTNVRSIVSLSPSSTEIVASFAGSTLLVGRTAADNYPTNFLKNVPIVVSVKPDFEKIKALDPDLVVFDSSLYSASDISKINDLGFKTFVFDAPTVRGYENQLFAFADLIGHQTDYSDYIDRIDVSLGNAAPKPSPSPKVAIILPEEGGTPMIAGTNTFEDDVFKEVGGTPVGPNVGNFVPLNPELLVSFNPDVIIVPTIKGTAAHDVDSITSDSRFKSTNAVKNGRVIPLDEDVVLRRGARVDHFIDGAYSALASNGSK